MKWFRFYHEFVDDPKIAMMSDSDQLLWVKALCLANDSKERGVITLSDDEICWKLRVSIEVWKHAIDKFRAKGMIEHCESGYKITNWNARQFKSDSSAERVAGHRSRQKELQAKGCNVTVTPPDQKQIQIQSTDSEYLEELCSSLHEESCESGEVQEVEGKSKSDRRSDRIKRDWLLNVFLVHYPARLDEETGKKSRAIGAIKKNPRKYFSHITVDAIESGAITNALREMVRVRLAEYRQKHHADPPKLTPRGSEQWVWSLPYIPDPANWLRNGSWLDELEESSQVERLTVAAPEDIDWSTYPQRTEWMAEMDEIGVDFIKKAPEPERSLRQAFVKWVLANRNTLAARN